MTHETPPPPQRGTRATLTSAYYKDRGQSNPPGYAVLGPQVAGWVHEALALAASTVTQECRTPEKM
jgi:hypothetical protein